jgi:hypothetical protein
MPRGDGTGPNGLGSGTGRGAGYCAGYSMPGFVNPVGGRGGFGWRNARFGKGLGRGRGHGFRRMHFAAGSAVLPMNGPGAGWVAPVGAMGREQEAAMLRDQARYMKESLDAINRRIEELEKSDTDDARSKNES